MEEEYLKRFNNLLSEVDDIENQLNDKKNYLNDKDYAAYKSAIDKERNKVIERIEYERNLYNSITDDNDKKAFYDYERIASGNFNDNDIIVSAYGISTKPSNFAESRSITGAQSQQPAVGDYSAYFNSFYTDKNGEIADDRTIEMGEPLYNKILNICEINNIDIKSLGITKNVGTHSFTIPKDSKAFIQFSDVYHQALNDSFGYGMFLNTANEFSNDKYKHQAGDILSNVGKNLNIRKNNRKEVEHKYGIDRYYLPVMQQYNDDITVQAMKAAGYNDTDIKYQRKLCTDVLKNMDLTSVELYVSEDDIAEGGQNPLTRCTDPKIKQRIASDIYRGIGDESTSTGDKTNDMLMSFSTLGDKSGTLITIPKTGENAFYKVFIPDALPNALKTAFDNNPQFRYTAKIDMWDAQANPNVPHRIAIGNALTGNIYAYGNGEYHFNNGTDDAVINKYAAVELQAGADMLMHMAINRNIQSKDDISYYDNEAMKVIDGGLAQTISAITDTPIEMVRTNLIKYYYKYYSK